METLDHLDRRDHLGHRVRLDLQDPQDHPVHWAHLVLMDNWVQKDQQETLDRREIKVRPEHRVLVNVDQTVLLVHQVQVEYLDQLVPMDSLEV